MCFHLNFNGLYVSIFSHNLCDSENFDHKFRALWQLCLLHSNGLLPLSTQTAEWLESAKEQYRVIFPCRDVGVNTCRHMHHPAPSCSIQQYPVLFLAPCRSEAFELGKNCACSDVGLFRCVACFWLQKSLLSSLDKSAKRTYQRIQLTPIVKRTLIH